jgi:hypothetical protein
MFQGGKTGTPYTKVGVELPPGADEGKQVTGKKILGPEGGAYTPGIKFVAQGKINRQPVVDLPQLYLPFRKGQVHRQGP